MLVDFLDPSFGSILDELLQAATLKRGIQVLGKNIPKVYGIFWRVVASYAPRHPVLVDTTHLAMFLGAFEWGQLFVELLLGHLQ